MNKLMRGNIIRFIKSQFPTLWMEIGLRWRKRHFEPEVFLLPLLCNKNQIAIDVGANQGIYTYCMAKFARAVVAFEPNADLIASLKKVATENVQLQTSALSNVCGESLMRIDPTNDGLSTIEHRNSFHSANPAVDPIHRYVGTRTLDSFEFADVSLIKIDVEGHEEAVIQGARKTIGRDNPAIIVESEDQHNSGAPRRISGMLAELGYRGFFVRDSELCDFTELKASETRASNYRRNIRYVNNFIYIQGADRDKISQIRMAAMLLK